MGERGRRVGGAGAARTHMHVKLQTEKRTHTLSLLVSFFISSKTKTHRRGGGHVNTQEDQYNNKNSNNNNKTRSRPIFHLSAAQKKGTLGDCALLLQTKNKKLEIFYRLWRFVIMRRRKLEPSPSLYVLFPKKGVGSGEKSFYTLCSGQAFKNLCLFAFCGAKQKKYYCTFFSAVPSLLCNTNQSMLCVCVCVHACVCVLCMCAYLCVSLF